VYFGEPNGTGEIIYSDDPIFPPPQDVYFSLTSVEQSAGVTPSDFSYPQGDIRRYGGVGNGITDESAAVVTWLNVGMQGVPLYLPEGTWGLAGWSVKDITAAVRIRGAGK